jgi:hypothetical protein
MLIPETSRLPELLQKQPTASPIFEPEECTTLEAM